MTPACPLTTVLYRFDDAARFPVFESHTKASGAVAVLTDRDDAGHFLRIVYERQAADADEFTIVLALPLIAVDCCRSVAESRADVAVKRQFLLDACGDASGCHLHLEGMDGRGNPLPLAFGPIDFAGWRTLRADGSRLVPPVQFHRLCLTAARSTTAVHVGVRTLSLTGDVRAAVDGIA